MWPKLIYCFVRYLKKIKFWVFQQYYRFNPKYKTKWVEDIPNKFEKKTIYILGGRKYPFQAIMQCPRFCKKKIYLNISHQHKKRWNIKEHNDGSISLNPSVLVNDQCNCHYWFTRGRIHWCEVPNNKIL